MSTLTYLDTTTNLAADRVLPDTEALTTFWANPEAVLQLVYGARTIDGATPAHDHEVDGGESLYAPILQHSWGSYISNTISRRGRPIGPPPPLVRLPLLRPMESLIKRKQGGC